MTTKSIIRAALLVSAVLTGAASEAIAATEAPIPLAPIPVPRQPATTPATTGTTPAAAPFDALTNPTASTPVTDPAMVLQNISTYFNSIRTMQGQFIQIGPNDERSEGTFYLSRPGKVRFRYQPPVRVDVVADGKSLSVEDKKAGTQDLYPLSKTPLKTLLADHIDLAQMRIVGDLREEGDLISVELAEPTFGDGKLTLMFDKTTYELRQWVVTDAQGLNTSVALYNVTLGEPLDPQLFRIYITNNTNPIR
jgi:outer membrane lipoprotein-sorting protein